MRDELEIEFVGGPYDGKTITITIPPFVGGAPEMIQSPVDVSVTAALWPERLMPGTLVDQYCAPAGDEELRAASAAYDAEEPVKYRYVGQGVFE